MDARSAPSSRERTATPLDVAERLAWFPRARPSHSRGALSLGTVLVVALCAGLAALMRGHFELSNAAMVFLLGVVVCGVAFGRASAIAASILSVAVFDYVFVPPYLTLRVTDFQYLVVFAVM